MTKPMHGSVSLPPVEDLASEYVLYIAGGKNEYMQDVWGLRQEIERRIGSDAADKLIGDTIEVYRLLSGG